MNNPVAAAAAPPPAAAQQKNDLVAQLVGLNEIDIWGQKLKGRYRRPEPATPGGKRGPVAMINAASASAFRPAGSALTVPLGYVKAILSVLGGDVADCDGVAAAGGQGGTWGAFHMSRGGASSFIWLWRSGELWVHYQPVYEIGYKGGIAVLLQALLFPSPDATWDEIQGRWIGLLDFLRDRGFYDKTKACFSQQSLLTIAQGDPAGSNVNVTIFHEHVDALADSLRFSLARVSNISPLASASPLALPGALIPPVPNARTIVELLSMDLAQVKGKPRGVAQNAGALSGISPLAGDSDEDEDDTSALDDLDTPPVAVAAPAVKARPPAKRDVLILTGPIYKRIQRAIDRPGDVFLFGPTATGKSALGEKALTAWLDRHGGGVLGSMTMNPQTRGDLVEGANKPKTWENPDGSKVPGYEWDDSEILEVIRHVAETGEYGGLSIDELGRAHPSMVSHIMTWLDTYTEEQVLRRKKLKIGRKSDNGLYRLIRLTEAAEVLVVPDHMKILACANIGESYQAIRLDDPAFRRRWGSFLFVGEQDRTQVGEILAVRLGLEATGPLVTALLKAQQAVREYEAKEGTGGTLVMGLNLDLLLKWGRDTLVRFDDAIANKIAGIKGDEDNDPSSPSGFRRNRARQEQDRKKGPLAKCFVESAADVWLDRVLPMNGNAPDGQVGQAVLALIESITMEGEEP